MSNVEKLIGDNSNKLQDSTVEEWQCRIQIRKSNTYVPDFNSCAHQPLCYVCRDTFISTTYNLRFESTFNTLQRQ